MQLLRQCGVGGQVAAVTVEGVVQPREPGVAELLVAHRRHGTTVRRHPPPVGQRVTTRRPGSPQACVTSASAASWVATAVVPDAARSRMRGIPASRTDGSIEPTPLPETTILEARSVEASRVIAEPAGAPIWTSSVRACPREDAAPVSPARTASATGPHR